MSQLPTLTVNESFFFDFMDAQAPCVALGLVEDAGETFGLISLRPGVVLPPEVTRSGFRFGHAVRGTTAFEVIWFSFEFYGFGHYHTLINPNDPIARAVIAQMLDRGEYSFLAVDQVNNVVVFRAELGEDVITGLREHWPRLEKSRTSPREYTAAMQQVCTEQAGDATYLEWVCRERVEYLDLTTERLDLKPSAE